MFVCVCGRGRVWMWVVVGALFCLSWSSLLPSSALWPRSGCQSPGQYSWTHHSQWCEYKQTHHITLRPHYCIAQTLGWDLGCQIRSIWNGTGKGSPRSGVAHRTALTFRSYEKIPVYLDINCLTRFAFSQENAKCDCTLKPVFEDTDLVKIEKEKTAECK